MWRLHYSSDKTFCRYCGSIFSFTFQGSYALKQHSKTKTHNRNHKVVHDNKNSKIALVFQFDRKAQSSLSSEFFKSQQPLIRIQSSIADRTTNAEILWMLKVASADYSLRSCNSIIKLFHNTFNCDVTRENDISLGCNKV